jgi:DNA polymerase-3 subunit delta
MDRELAERIAAAVGAGYAVGASEVTKLALYLDATQERPRAATREAYEAWAHGPKRMALPLW